MTTLIPEVFWLSFRLRPFVKLNELKPTELRVRLVTLEENGSGLTRTTQMNENPEDE